MKQLGYKNYSMVQREMKGSCYLSVSGYNTNANYEVYIFGKQNVRRQAMLLKMELAEVILTGMKPNNILILVGEKKKISLLFRKNIIFEV